MITTLKPVIRVSFLFICSFCFCVKAFGQNIELSLEIERYSPFILKYTKEQMTRKLLDTVIAYSQSRLLKLGRHVNIYAKGNTRPESDLPGYKLELSVTDSTFNTERFTGVHSVIFKSKFYEEEIPAENIKEWMKAGGASYSLMPIGRSSSEAQTTQADAILAYFTWAKIEAGIAIDCLMPLSLTERIPARNLFAKEEIDRLESFAEMAIKVEFEKTGAIKKIDGDRLITMI